MLGAMGCRDPGFALGGGGEVVLLISGPGHAGLTDKWVHCTGCHGSLGIPGGGYNR